MDDLSNAFHWHNPARCRRITPTKTPKAGQYRAASHAASRVAKSARTAPPMAGVVVMPLSLKGTVLTNERIIPSDLGIRHLFDQVNGLTGIYCLLRRLAYPDGPKAVVQTDIRVRMFIAQQS